MQGKGEAMILFFSRSWFTKETQHKASDVISDILISIWSWAGISTIAIYGNRGGDC